MRESWKEKYIEYLEILELLLRNIPPLQAIESDKVNFVTKRMMREVKNSRHAGDNDHSIL